MDDGATSLGVMVFPPRDDAAVASRSFWTFATNGLSERRMPCRVPPHGDPSHRLELIAYTQEYAEWVELLLAELAAYPFIHGSGLAVGHTLPVRADAENPWHGYLLNPLLCEAEDFDPLAIDLGFDDWVFYAQVVGLLGPELETAISIGGPAFRDRYLPEATFREHSYLDVVRPSLAAT